MFGNHFYHAAIRRTVAVFGTLFNDINVLRNGSDGTAKNIVKVPLAYGPKQKFLARLDQQKDLDDPRIALKLPRMSFELTSLVYNPNVKLQKGVRQTFNDPDDNDKKKTVLGPVGYSLGISLNIMAKNQDDALQIIEQILPFFQPEYTVSVKEVDNNFKSDQPFVLSGVTLTDDYEGDFTSRRAIVYTLDFETKVNFYGGISSKSVIKDVFVDYNSRADIALKPIERQKLSVDPSTAGPDDTYSVTEVIYSPEPDYIIISMSGVSADGYTKGEVVTANNSGADGTVYSFADNKLTITYVNGTFNNTDTITGADSGTTGDVDSLEEFWNA